MGIRAPAIVLAILLSGCAAPPAGTDANRTGDGPADEDGSAPGTTPSDEGAPGNEPVGQPDPYAELPVLRDSGNVIVFDVIVPSWTRSTDLVFLRIDNAWHPPGGGFPMTKIGEHRWATKLRASEGETLTYRYNRNDFGFPTDEQFEPDREESPRTFVATDAANQSRNDTVAGWRWLRPQPPEANLSDFVPLPEHATAGNGSFALGISFFDFYQGRFGPHRNASLDRLAQLGFQWVGLTWAALLIENGDPVAIRSSEGSHNTYSRSELATTIAAARERGFRVLLAVGTEVDLSDPTRTAAIQDALASEHPGEWYSDYVSAWTAGMTDAARFADANGVEILVPSNQWPFLGLPRPSQVPALNAQVRNALRAVNENFSGALASDFYMEQEGFDYYAELDWVGDKWWYPLTEVLDPSPDALLLEAKRRVDEFHRPIRERYGKPIFLAQVAYPAWDGAGGAVQISSEDPSVYEGFPYNDTHPFDFQEQADAYEAVLRAIHGVPWIQGAFSFGYSYWDSHDKSPGIRDKPAERVWTKWANAFRSAPEAGG